MKPKISTGYLTPQIKKKKNVARGRLSDAEETPSEPGIDESIFAALMKCPEKKKMILELLSSNKDAIEKYKKNEVKNINSPLGKIKKKKKTCESPTALLRRRALEQMNTSPSSTNKLSSSRSELSRPSSRCSEASSDHSASPISFDKVLDGVVAYVEIKNKDQDRSSGAKAILKSMGAELREKFTNDVTHVIFKDGSFMTYQKAKLLKIHLVSILWVEFCRKRIKRQPEKQYPALKSGFQDNETSMVCSQMQREYEDIIRDEYRRSIRNGTPLPSTRSFIDRRRTLMTPSVSNLNSSSTSFQTALEGMSSQEQSDREVATINGFQSENENVEGENLILNDPDCFSEVSGPMVDGNTVEKREKRNSITNCILKSLENLDGSIAKRTIINNSKSLRPNSASPQKQISGSDSDMELTMMLNSNKTPKTKGSKMDIYNEKTPKIPFKKNLSILLDRRKTICSSLLSSDTSTTSLISSDKSKNASSLLSSDKSTNISDNASFAVPKTVKKSNLSNSSLFGSNESFEFGKNKVKSSAISREEVDKTSSAMSELHLSSDKDISKKSSLHISSGERDGELSTSLISDKNNSKGSAVMSTLPISSESKESKKSKSSTKRSNSITSLWLSSKPKTNEKYPDRSTSMSELHLTSENLNKNKKQSAVSTVQVTLSTNNKIVDESSMGSLHISSEDNKKCANKSSMSSLQVSAESRSSGRNNDMKNNKNNSLNSDLSVMSSLHLSSEKEPSNSLRQSKERPSNKASFSSLDEDNSRGITNVVQAVIENLHTPESVTVTKKFDQSPSHLSKDSINSDDSEILSPRRTVRRTMSKKKSENKLEDSTDSNSNSDDNLSKDRELELLSTVTIRRKTLGSRRVIKTVSRTLPKDFPVNKNKELVVDILKSNFAENLLNDNDDSEIKGTLLLNKPRRRTLSKRLTGTDSPQMPQKGSDVSTENSESEIDRSLNNKTKSDDSSDSTKSKKKLRKLYNPDDSIHVLIDDEQEREEKRLEVRKRKSEEGVFIHPSDILKSSDKHPRKSSSNERINLESLNNTVTPPKQTKKGNKKDLKRASLNSSADEQKELLDEVINRKKKQEVIPKTPKNTRKSKVTTPKKVQTPDETPSRRKSMRIIKTSLKVMGSQTPKKVQTPAETPSRRKSMRIIKPSLKVIESQTSDMKSDIPITPINRRSTLDFQPKSSGKKPKKIDKMKMPTIVCTKLHKSDVQVFTQIIKKLGRFIVEDEVTNRTTHLVAGEPKRTINMLRAISRGCWVLKFEWVLQSLEAGKWLREDDFEVHDFSPAVQKCRFERQAFGLTYTLDVFESCPPIYVALSTNPRCSDLKELITTCRGKVVTTPRMAKIIVGEFLNQENTVCVNETWVLDCITYNKRIGFKKQYLLDKDKVSNNKRKSLVV